MAILKALLADEQGFVVSTELVVIGTLLVVGVITGIQAIQASVVGEMQELSSAFGSLDQSYRLVERHGRSSRGDGRVAWTAGSRFLDGDYDTTLPVGTETTDRICCPEPVCRTEVERACAPADVCGACFGGCRPVPIVRGCWSGCRRGPMTGCGGCAPVCNPYPLPCNCEPVPVVPQRAPCPKIEPACATCDQNCGLPGADWVGYPYPNLPCSPCAPSYCNVIW